MIQRETLDEFNNTMGMMEVSNEESFMPNRNCSSSHMDSQKMK